MERDEETGLSVHGVRYYAAWLGRWERPDPSGGVNRYVYVSNNPVGKFDPDGRREVESNVAYTDLTKAWLNAAVSTAAAAVAAPFETVGGYYATAFDKLTNEGAGSAVSYWVETTARNIVLSPAAAVVGAAGLVVDVGSAAGHGLRANILFAAGEGEGALAEAAAGGTASGRVGGAALLAAGTAGAAKGGAAGLARVVGAVEASPALLGARLTSAIASGSAALEAEAAGLARGAPLVPASVGAEISATAEAVAPRGAGRVFTSTDPLVGDLASRIDALAPGRVVGVNRELRDALGNRVTDLDVELADLVIQVKSGTKLGGGVEQVAASSAATGKPSVLYAPNLKPGALKEARRQGAEVYTTFDDLRQRLGL
jgi:hypothetical protein